MSTTGRVWMEAMLLRVIEVTWLEVASSTALAKQGRPKFICWAGAEEDRPSLYIHRAMGGQTVAAREKG